MSIDKITRRYILTIGFSILAAVTLGMSFGIYKAIALGWLNNAGFVSIVAIGVGLILAVMLMYDLFCALQTFMKSTKE